MLPPDNMTCHETGHKKKCKDICINCWKWIQVQGQDSNTGEQLNEWRCADNWIVHLTIENSKEQRQTSASIDSFRNEVVKQNDIFLSTTMGNNILVKEIK